MKGSFSGENSPRKSVLKLVIFSYKNLFYHCHWASRATGLKPTDGRSSWPLREILHAQTNAFHKIKTRNTTLKWVGGVVSAKLNNLDRQEYFPVYWWIHEKGSPAAGPRTGIRNLDQIYIWTTSEIMWPLNMIRNNLTHRNFTVEPREFI